MTVSGNWAAPLTAIAARLATECASGIPDPDDESGGVGGLFTGGVEILIGDENLGKHRKTTVGRVVLTMGGANGSANLTGQPGVQVLCTTLAEYEAHLWVPTERVAQIARLSLVSKLFACVIRAIAHVHAGAQHAAKINTFERWEPAREIELFRDGQAGVVTFVVPTPISKGRPVQVLEGDSRFGTPGDGDTNLFVNTQEQ